MLFIKADLFFEIIWQWIRILDDSVVTTITIAKGTIPILRGIGAGGGGARGFGGGLFMGWDLPP